MNSHTSALSLTLAGLLLVACGGSDNTGTSTPTTQQPDPVVMVEPEPAMPSEPVHVFDGYSTEAISTAQGQENYEIELQFTTDPDFSYSSDFTDFSPPMPFKSDNLRAYLRDGRYSIRVVAPDGEKPTTFGRVGETANVTFRAVCGVATLEVDGREVYSGPVASNMGKLYLGGGFKQRNWAGEFTKADVRVLDPQC